MVESGGEAKAELSAATQREAAIRLQAEIGSRPVEATLEETTALLIAEDRVLSEWVNGRVRGLYEGQTTRLAAARRARADLETGMTDVAGDLRTGRQALREARQQLTELEAAQAGRAEFSREQLEAIKAYPAFMGFQLERRAFSDERDLYSLLRFLPERQGVVYDLGDWKLRLSRLARNDYCPLLYLLRSGRTDGYDYPGCWDRRFEFEHRDYQSFQQHIQNGEVTPALDTLWRGLLNVGGDYTILDQLRVVKDADPARVVS